MAKANAKQNFSSTDPLSQLIYYPDVLVREVAELKADKDYKTRRAILHEDVQKTSWQAKFSAPAKTRKERVVFTEFVRKNHVANLQKMQKEYADFDAKRAKLADELKAAKKKANNNMDDPAVQAANKKYHDFVDANKPPRALIFGCSVDSKGNVSHSLLASKPEVIAKFVETFPRAILEDAKKSKMPLIRITASIGPQNPSKDSKRFPCFSPLKRNDEVVEGYQVLSGVLPNDKTYTKIRITLTDRQAEALKEKLGQERSRISIITPFYDMNESVNDRYGRTIFVNNVTEDSIKVLAADDKTFEEHVAERRDMYFSRVAEFCGYLKGGDTIEEACKKTLFENGRGEKRSIAVSTGVSYVGALVANEQITADEAAKFLATMTGKVDKTSVKSVVAAIAKAEKAFAKEGKKADMLAVLPKEMYFVADYVAQREEVKAAIAENPAPSEEEEDAMQKEFDQEVGATPAP